MNISHRNVLYCVPFYNLAVIRNSQKVPEVKSKRYLQYTCLGGLRLDTNRLNTSHSQRLNSGKPLCTDRCGW